MSFVLCLHDTGDGGIRIWKDYSVKSQQTLVTAFYSIPGHRPGVPSMNAVVDWQQQSGFLVHTILSMTSTSNLRPST